MNWLIYDVWKRLAHLAPDTPDGWSFPDDWEGMKTLGEIRDKGDPSGLELLPIGRNEPWDTNIES